MKFDIGAATRPCPGFLANGDRYHITDTGEALVVAMMDGLGHGGPASEASDVAVACLVDDVAGGAESFFRRCHSKLYGSRGVVAGIATIDRSLEIVRFTGIGNIEAEVCTDGSVDTLISSWGILGAGVLPNMHERQAPFPPGAMLIMYSDGISSKFKLSDYDGLRSQSAQFIADVIMRDWSRINDDATIVVVRRETE